MRSCSRTYTPGRRATVRAIAQRQPGTRTHGSLHTLTKTPGRRALGDITNSKRNAPASAGKGAAGGATPGLARKVQQAAPAAPVHVDEVEGASKLSSVDDAPFVDPIVEAGVQALLRAPGAEMRGHLKELPGNLALPPAAFEEEAVAVRTDEEVLGLLLEEDALGSDENVGFEFGDAALEVPELDFAAD